MSQVDIDARNKKDANWRRLRPVTILVTDEQYDALQRLFGREPRYLPRLAELLSKPSVIEGTQSGDSPTPG